MKPPAFAYYAPTTVDEAVDLLAGVDGAKVLAGGQSLVPLMNMRLAAPAALIDIGRVAELSTITLGDDVQIGAGVTHQHVLDDRPTRSAQPALAHALNHVAHPVIRNRGTTVGSIVHADPAAEMPALLVLLGGAVDVVSRRGTRCLDAADFFLGPLESAVAPDELATAVRMPRARPRSGTAVHELARRHGDYALAGVVAQVELDADGDVAGAWVACIGTDPIPRRLDLTTALGGQRPANLRVDDAVTAVRAAVDPVDDIHASADYRRHLVGVLTARALHDAAAAATHDVRDEGVRHG